MAKRVARKKYGTTNIGGRAKVQLGDTHIDRTVTVGTLNVSLPEELVALLEHTIRDINIKDGKLLAGTTRLEDTPVSSSSLASRRLLLQQDQHYEAESLKIITEVDNVDLKRLASLTRTWICNTLQPPLSQAHLNSDHTSDSQLDDSPDRQALIPSLSNERTILRDHGLAGLAILSWIAGRNISATDLAKIVSRCASDDLLSLFVLVCCIGAYRYFTMKNISRAPPQHFWQLEDAYGYTINISTDVLIDYSVFQQYLHVHYRNGNRNTGAALVKLNRFHLVLGSRRGTTIHSHNWATGAKRIRPNTRVINAVFVDAKDKNCFACRNEMVVTDYGEFHCLICNTFHRDFSTLAPHQPEQQESDSATQRQKLAESKYTNSREPASLENLYEYITPDDLTASTSNPSESDFHKIKHLDLRLRPPDPSASQPTSRQMSNVLRQIMDVCPPSRYGFLEGELDLSSSDHQHIYVAAVRIMDSSLAAAVDLAPPEQFTFENDNGQFIARCKEFSNSDFNLFTMLTTLPRVQVNVHRDEKSEIVTLSRKRSSSHPADHDSSQASAPNLRDKEQSGDQISNNKLSILDGLLPQGSDIEDDNVTTADNDTTFESDDSIVSRKIRESIQESFEKMKNDTDQTEFPASESPHTPRENIYRQAVHHLEHKQVHASEEGRDSPMTIKPDSPSGTASARPDRSRPALKSILKPPRQTPFPEDPNPMREGVAPAGQASSEGIPPNARWTKISRVLVNPEALQRANERFEERDDFVIVLRVLNRKEIEKLAEVTKEIRGTRNGELVSQHRR